MGQIYKIKENKGVRFIYSLTPACKIMVSDLFHSGGHKSFAFINARLRILLPPAFAGKPLWLNIL